MKSEYFLVLAATLFFPLALSFTRKFRIAGSPLQLVVSILAMCIPYWVWDVIVTEREHWWFNADHVVGWIVWGLPIEEWLFFVVIGFNAIFTWNAINAVVGGRK